MNLKSEILFKIKIADEDERLTHSVYREAYWIDKTEVTNAKSLLCIAANEWKLLAQSKYYPLSESPINRRMLSGGD